MMKVVSRLRYFSIGELMLWSGSNIVIITSFCLFNGGSYLTLIASLIGSTSLIFNAKGNPIGQFLMVIFSLLYGIISFGFSYYGEMITYVGMTMPMAIVSLNSWIKNPYNGNQSEVEIYHIQKKDIFFMTIFALAVTTLFYFILSALNTKNLFISTLSVATSFISVYLTFKRSPYYALGYAANDLILIVLWMMATIENIAYLSVVVCFIAFLVNDIYGYINWVKIGRRQLSQN